MSRQPIPLFNCPSRRRFELASRAYKVQQSLRNNHVFQIDSTISIVHLAKYSLELSCIANVNLLISSMELFPAINKVYASLFGISPPARACVAVDLPAQSRVRLECIAYA